MMDDWFSGVEPFGFGELCVHGVPAELIDAPPSLIFGTCVMRPQVWVVLAPVPVSGRKQQMVRVRSSLS